MKKKKVPLSDSRRRSTAYATMQLFHHNSIASKLLTESPTRMVLGAGAEPSSQ